MLIKFLALPLSLVLFMSVSSFADTVEVRTDEPESQYLGMKIDLQGRDFLKKMAVDKNSFLLIDQQFTDVRVKKDTKNSLNKFYALIGYNLYVNNSKQSPTRFLYVQCPVTRETYVDRSSPFRDEMIDGEILSVQRVNIDVSKKEFLDLGSYSFLSSPKDKVPLLSKNFPMVGKVSQHPDIEYMCLQIQVAYAGYEWSETFRRITLESFGIFE